MKKDDFWAVDNPRASQFFPSKYGIYMTEGSKNWNLWRYRTVKVWLRLFPENAIFLKFKGLI